MTRGGARSGAGRKAGTANKRTREVADRASAEGITPLEVMLAAMRKAYDAGKLADAAAFAKDAAPYMHARMATIDARVDAKVGLTVEMVEFTEKDCE